MSAEPAEAPAEAQAEEAAATDAPAEEWIMCTPPTGVKKTKFEVVKLKENQAYRFRVCAINKVGVGEHADVSGAVVAQDRTEEPDLDIDPELRKIVTIKAGASLRLFIPIKGRPTPTIKWDKDEAALKETAQVEVTSSYTSLVIDKMSRNDSGKYTVTAENSSGTKSAFVVVRVLDTPSAPVNLKVKEITNQSVTLAWEPPLLDGGSKIKNYIVEKRESTRKTYAAAVTNCHALSWKIEPLQEGCSYYFRVLAENAHGVGLPAATVDPLKVSEVPQSPKNLIVTDQTKTSISLAWEKPEYDGGSRVMQYLLEVQLKGQEKWSGVNTFKTMEATVSKLNPGEEYLFRVTAINDKGKSDPKVLAGPVMTKDLVFEPDVRPAFSSYSVHVGKDMNIDIPIFGRPKPAVSWTKDGAPLKVTTRVNILNTPTHTTLSIKDAAGDDGGMYSINVSNSAGKKDTTVEIIVLDKPGPPSGPVRFDEITTQSISISWDPPKHNGGCQISNYIVQKRDTTTTTWENVSINCARTSIKVSGPITATDEIEAPRASMDPKYKDVIVINAGENLLLDADIHGKPIPDVAWLKEGKEMDKALRIEVKTTEKCAAMTIKDVTKLDSGHYDLVLKNLGGIKTFPITVKVLDKPGPPTGPLRVTGVMADRCILSWSEPTLDGGARITHYVLEKRETSRLSWTVAAPDIKGLFYKLTSLLPGNEYIFRVRALNKYGVGDYLESEPIIARNPYKPPSVTLVDLTKTSVSLAWEKPAHDGGSKVICYNVEFKPKSGDKWGTACTVKVPEATIPNLTPNEAYLFRVVAINEKGKSEPKDLGLPVVAKDVAIEPSLNLLFTTYSVKAGDDLTLEVPVRGRPKPVVSWKKDGLPLKQTSSVTILNTATSSKILIKQASREHVGKYEITLANTAGTVTTDVGVVVLDKPGPPKGIKVDAVTSDSITLSWSPPDYDGGCSISNYIVEKRDTNTQEWQMAASNVARTCFKAGRLTHGAEYQFRIYAVNRYGKSTYLDSPGITAQYNFKQPGPPSTPIVKLATKSYIPVLGYHVERKERSSILWTKMNRGMIKDTEYKVNAIEEGMILHSLTVVLRSQTTLLRRGTPPRDPILQ
uniref:Titin n=1 Tax=Seriola lalandi dorsalis TaxID=1841481 RepID=A0A3B4WXM7_SERLL